MGSSNLVVVNVIGRTNGGRGTRAKVLNGRRSQHSLHGRRVLEAWLLMTDAGRGGAALELYMR